METSKISYRQWRANLWMYVLGTMCLTVSAGVVAVDFSQTKCVVAFFAGVLGSGIMAAKAYTGRAYDVEPKIETPSTGTNGTGPL